MKNTVAPFIASESVADTPFSLVLQGNSNKQVGKITIDKDKVSFEGDCDESAQTFLDHLIRKHSQQWAEMEKRAVEYDRFMTAMETAKEALAAGTPLDLESLFKGELASAMFATMFAGEFVRHGATNYLELTYSVPKLGPFTVTIQRKEGKTPCERIAELEAVVEQRNAECDRLINERDALREGEMGDAKHSNTRAAADIYFQLVEECQIPPGGSLVRYVHNLEEKVKGASA